MIALLDALILLLIVARMMADARERARKESDDE